MSKRPLRLFASALCILSVAAVLPAQQGDQPARGEPTPPPQNAPDGRRGPGGPGGPRGPGGPGGDVSVKFVMKGMKRAGRQLAAQITDATKREENLHLVNDMQRGCVLAKGQPLQGEFLRAAKTDADKARMREAYRVHLFTALRMLMGTESLIAEGKGEAAKAKLEEVFALSEKAHEEFGVTDD